MNDTVSWILMLSVKPGELENFRTLMEEMVAHTERNEPGTLAYEWFVSEDGSAVHLYERYADSAAALAHIAGFGENFAGRFMAAVEPTGYFVYGNPNDEVRSAVATMGARILGPFGGFAR